MDQSEDPRELELKIERASRIASRVTDQTTIELLGAWVEELRQKLRQLLDARRTREHRRAGRNASRSIRLTAHEIKPAGSRWRVHAAKIGAGMKMRIETVLPGGSS